MQAFKDLKQLLAYFSDQKTCLAYLEEQLWNGKPVCPHCGSEKVYRLADGKNFKCGDKKNCDRKFNVLIGSYYENTKIHLSIWFGAIWLLTSHRKGISSHQVARLLGTTQKTGWHLLHRIRLMLREPDTEPLSNIVEADETYCGGKFENMNRGRRKKWQQSGKDNKVALMGMVERGGKARLKVIGNETFKDTVRQHIHPSAFLITDTHSGYKGLDQEFARHESVNHSQSEYKRGEVYTNTVESFFSLFKRGYIGVYHSMSEKHLFRYCDEFAARYNMRKLKDGDRFKNAILQSRGRLKYADLIKND
jgi:transposase-like protein